MYAMPKGLTLLCSGKGKDLWTIDKRPEFCLMVFRDSVSTHNIVHASEFPGKGEIILAQTLFTALEVLDRFPTHLTAYGTGIYDFISEPEGVKDLHHRAFIVGKREKPRYEMIFRRYNAGSLAKALREQGRDPYGHELDGSVPLMHRFDDWLFTPTLKSKKDPPVRAGYVEQQLPQDVEAARRAVVAVEEYLKCQGIGLVDAKLELYGVELIDDWFNGDCTRMALLSDIKEGEEPPFLDKEVIRQEAVRMWGDSPRGPLTFSDEQVKKGLDGYHRAFEIFSGMSLSEFQREYLD